MADLTSEPERGGSDRIATPRWVKLFAIAITVVALLFVALHLTGHGFSSHMSHAASAQSQRS